MYYDSERRVGGDGDPGLPWNPFKALVAPRPIGWISSLTRTGVVNLAPFSFFQAVADRPDVVMFSTEVETPASSGPGGPDGERKDSHENATVLGEFVCNLVSWNMREAMNTTSLRLPPDQSEAEHAGLQLAPSRRVGPPRVVGAPAALECLVVDSRQVVHRHGLHRFHMIFGEVVGIHIDDRFVREGRVDTVAMQLIGRLGYDEYSVLDRTFRMTRPDV
ncbi:flavin reductase family protein [Blastococcus deserti]|uniref:Flavin reductase family protein n=1 Tax=Blastococcus deserti TaxID=2259033 RepID=A0ABW4X8E9_9ACTN